MSLFRNSYISVYSFFSLTFFWVYSWQSLIVYFILQEETRLKTVCMNASPIDWVQDGQRLITEINALLNWTIHTFTLTMEHYLWNWRLVSSMAGLLEFTNLNRSGIIKFPYYMNWLKRLAWCIASRFLIFFRNVFIDPRLSKWFNTRQTEIF